MAKREIKKADLAKVEHTAPPVEQTKDERLDILWNERIARMQKEEAEQATRAKIFDVLMGKAKADA